MNLLTKYEINYIRENFGEADAEKEDRLEGGLWKTWFLGRWTTISVLTDTQRHRVPFCIQIEQVKTECLVEPEKRIHPYESMDRWDARYEMWIDPPTKNVFS